MSLQGQASIAAVAFLLSLAVTPVARRAALRWNLVDHPAARKLHIDPTPLLGGLAIYAAALVSLAMLVDLAQSARFVIPLAGGTVIFALGLWDDRRTLAPALKFGVQVVVALGVVASGIHIRLFGPEWVNVSVTVLWLLGITNAFNLLDNMDGLSAGVGAVAATFFLLFSFLTGNYLAGCLSAALIGACLGFLIFNYDPARIFMGDAGSLFIGFMLALIGLELRFVAVPSTTSWMIPVLVLGVPIFDTTLVTLSRIRHRTRVWVGGKDHLSHRLRLLGWSTRRVVLVLYAGAALLGLAALIVYTGSRLIAHVVQAGVLLSALACFWYCERLYAASREYAEAGG